MFALLGAVGWVIGFIVFGALKVALWVARILGIVLLAILKFTGCFLMYLPVMAYHGIKYEKLKKAKADPKLIAEEKQQRNDYLKIMVGQM